MRESQFTQETAEDEERARHRAMLTAERKAKQSKQRADEKRIREDELRDDYMKKILAVREDRLQKNRTEEDPDDHDERQREIDKANREGDSKRSKDNAVKGKQLHLAASLSAQLAKHELKQDYNTDDSEWAYQEPDDPRSFEKQNAKTREKGFQNVLFTGMIASEHNQSRGRSVSLKTKKSHQDRDKSGSYPPSGTEAEEEV